MTSTTKRWIGFGLLAVVAVLILFVFVQVREPLGRVLGTFAHDAFGGVRGDRRFEVDRADDVRRGDPVYLAERADALRPIGYVTRVEPRVLYVRVVRGESLADDLVLKVHGAPQDLGASLRLAVPPATLAALEAEVGDEMRTLLRDAILPAVKRELPGFLARVDPRRDPRAREVLQSLSDEVMRRLKPLGEDLASQVAADVERRYDLLARLGLLWQMVRGDSEGLKRDLTPVATESAKRWWEEHQDDVLTKVGEAIVDRGDELQGWISSEVLTAAKEELLEPVLASQGKRIEHAADRLLRRASAAVVESPAGGFRLQFATVLRTRLLEKDSPLLLLERP